MLDVAIGLFDLLPVRSDSGSLKLDVGLLFSPTLDIGLIVPPEVSALPAELNAETVPDPDADSFLSRFFLPASLKPSTAMSTASSACTTFARRSSDEPIADTISFPADCISLLPRSLPFGGELPPCSAAAAAWRSIFSFASRSFSAAFALIKFIGMAGSSVPTPDLPSFPSLPIRIISLQSHGATRCIVRT